LEDYNVEKEEGLKLPSGQCGTVMTLIRRVLEILLTEHHPSIGCNELKTNASVLWNSPKGVLIVTIDQHTSTDWTAHLFLNDSSRVTQKVSQSNNDH